MRLVRVLAIILFIASLGTYMGTRYYESQREDHTKPVITSEVEVLALSVEDGNEHLIDGLVAADEKDGDISQDILVTSKSLFTEKGTASIKYVVFDKDNHFATFKRQVTYTDYKSPEFSLTEPLVFSRGTTIDFVSDIQANDDLDGDLTDQIKTTKDTTVSSELGVYPVTVEVTNSFGDTASVNLNVLVRDKKNEADIHLNSYLLYVDKGSSFSPVSTIKYITDGYGQRYDVYASGGEESEYRAFDGEGNTYCILNVSGSVDTSRPGCYQLTYSYESEDAEAVAYQTVVVRE